MNRKFRKTASLILLVAYLAPVTIFADNVFFYDFDDETEGEAAASGTETITDIETSSGTTNGTLYYDSGSVLFEATSGYSDKSLYYSSTTGSGAKIGNVTGVNWGSKFLLEARIKTGEIPSGEQIDLIKSSTSGAVHWYITSNGKVHLDLDDPSDSDSVSAVTTDSVITPNVWTELHVTVDLSKSSISNAIKMYIKADGETPYLGNYFGESALGDVVISSNTQYDSTQDGAMLVKHFSNLTVNSGYTLTTDDRCRGMMLLVNGDLTVNGTISMTARGAKGNPATEACNGQTVDSNGLQLSFYTENGTASGSSDLNGCGSDAQSVAEALPTVNSNGTVINIARTGGSGGAVAGPLETGNAGGTTATSSGGGGSGGASYDKTSGAGAAGTCFSGGSGGGGVYHYLSSADDADAIEVQPDSSAPTSGGEYGGTGGDGHYAHLYNTESESYEIRKGGGGAGNPAGGYSGASAAQSGTGGLLVILVSGNVTIGSSGRIESNGSNGGQYFGYGGGGGGSGGGVIVLGHAGSLTNNGAIDVSGGSGGMGYDWYHAPGTIYNGGNGGAGSIQTLQINNGTGKFPALAGGSSSNLTGISLPTSDAIELAKRSSNFSLKTEFIKAAVSYSGDFDSNNFETLSSSANYFAPGSSDSIDVTPANFIRRVLNRGTDFTNGSVNSGVTLAYDSEANRNKAFHGVFELKFKLDTTQYLTGSSVTVDIKIKRPEDSAFKKIGQVETTMPASGDWEITYYWDSRTANTENGCEWTGDDAKPYKSKGPVKFKIVVR